MSWFNKVIWSEGLFLQPQHFQQHDRYLENLVDARCSSLRPHAWGVTALEIDPNMLGLGRFGLAACRGVFPDGTPFNVPDESSAPQPLDIAEDITSQIVYLALPLRRAGEVETETDGQEAGLARFRARDWDAGDTNAGQTTNSTLQVGQLSMKLMLEKADRSSYACIPLARIRERSPEKGIILDDAFLPTCMHCAASAKLLGLINELYALLQQRGEALAGIVSGRTGGGGVSEVGDFMMLQLVNRFEPLVAHLTQLPGLHPESFYRHAVQLAGELATFAHAEKRPPKLAAYRHDALAQTFDPLMKELRFGLQMAIEQRAIGVEWEERQYGVRIAQVSDRGLFASADFVLAVTADVRPEVIQNQFPAQAKLGPVEYIRQLVNSGLPGIGLRVLPVAPREIRYHAGATYFELDRTSRYWEALSQSGAIALHVAGDFPGLKLELWAIKR